MFTMRKFFEKYDPTIEGALSLKKFVLESLLSRCFSHYRADVYQRTIKLKGKEYVLDILDTAGEPRFYAMIDINVRPPLTFPVSCRCSGVSKMKYRYFMQQINQGNGFLLVFDCTAPKTLESLRNHYNDVVKNKKMDWMSCVRPDADFASIFPPPTQTRPERHCLLQIDCRCNKD
jgi:GTPase SAR1 family protein